MELSNNPNLGREHFHWLFFFSRTPQLLKTVILFPNLCKKKEYPYRANFTKLAARTWTILSKNEIQAKGFRMI